MYIAYIYIADGASLYTARDQYRDFVIKNLIYGLTHYRDYSRYVVSS